MTLQDLFRLLSMGELSQLAVGGDENGGLTVENKEKMVSAIRMGLTALSTRFLLKEGSVRVVRNEGQTVYLLTKDYTATVAEPKNSPWHIDDRVNSFDNDVLRIERIVGNISGNIPVNEIDKPLSIRTDESNSMVVPEELPDEYFTVYYRADHTHINEFYAVKVPDQVQINIPGSHIPPLLSYVAMRVTSGRPANNGVHDSNNYNSKYEMECAKLEASTGSIETFMEADRFTNNGFI